MTIKTGRSFSSQTPPSVHKDHSSLTLLLTAPHVLLLAIIALGSLHFECPVARPGEVIRSDGAPALPADPKQDIYSVIYLFQIMADYYQIRAPLIQNIQLDRRCLIIPTGYQLLVQIYDELYRLSAPLSSPTLAPSAVVSAPPIHYPTPVAAR